MFICSGSFPPTDELLERLNFTGDISRSVLKTEQPLREMRASNRERKFFMIIGFYMMGLRNFCFQET